MDMNMNMSGTGNGNGVRPTNYYYQQTSRPQVTYTNSSVTTYGGNTLSSDGLMHHSFGEWLGSLTRSAVNVVKGATWDFAKDTLKAAFCDENGHLSLGQTFKTAVLVAGVGALCVVGGPAVIGALALAGGAFGAWNAAKNGLEVINNYSDGNFEAAEESAGKVGENLSGTALALVPGMQEMEGGSILSSATNAFKPGKIADLFRFTKANAPGTLTRLTTAAEDAWTAAGSRAEATAAARAATGRPSFLSRLSNKFTPGDIDQFRDFRNLLKSEVAATAKAASKASAGSAEAQAAADAQEALEVFEADLKNKTGITGKNEAEFKKAFKAKKAEIATGGPSNPFAGQVKEVAVDTTKKVIHAGFGSGNANRNMFVVANGQRVLNDAVGDTPGFQELQQQQYNEGGRSVTIG